MSVFVLDIKDPTDYDPRKIEDEILRDDWRIVVAWWARILEGKPFKYSKEEVLNLAFLIYQEMKKRKFEVSPESEAGKQLVALIESGQIVDAMAMYIVPRHAHMIASGEKTLLVKSKPFKIAGMDFVLITKEEGQEDAVALGRVKLGDMKEVTLKQFYKLESKHKITEKEADEWWPDRGTLYTWPIDKFIAYKKPRRIVWTPGVQTFVRTVKFIDTKALAEVKSSGFQGTGDRIYLADILPVFNSFYIKKPFIHLVGGICNHPSKGTTGDIDILIDKTHVDEDDLALEFRLYRQFPKELWTRLHFLYDQEHRGPFTNHVPLYNLYVERSEHQDVVLMSALDQLRAAPPGLRSQASTSRKENKIVPFRFYLQVKPTHGRKQGQIYSLENLEEVLESFDGWKDAVADGVFIERKYDGMRVQIHKVKNRIEIWTEDGSNITDNIPELRDAFLDINLDFVSEGEIELYLDGVHQNRADSAGAVNAGDPKLTPHLRATIYDVVWFEGKDIHLEPYEKRVASINRIRKKPRVQPASRVLARGMDNVLSEVRKAAAEEGSEGAILKMQNFPYELDGKTKEMLKFKNEFRIVAEVLKRSTVKGQTDVFYYHMGVRRPDGSLAYSGKTFNTKIKAEPGDRLEVVFVEMNLYKDPETDMEWVNWWAPRVVGTSSKKTATLAQAKRLVARSGGQVSVKREPSVDGAFTDADPLLEYAPEGKCMPGIVHAHLRGRSVHLDLRIKINDDFLIGWTLFVPKGLSRDATSLADARKLYKEEIEGVIREKLETATINFNGKPKPREPIEWLTFEGEAKPGQIGATRYEHGYFIIIDKFCVEWGAQKSWFHEYFFKGGKLFDGRIVARLLENKAQWKKTPEGNFTWMLNRAKFNPYTISKRASDIKWMPPLGISALPADIRKQIPKELAYWKEKTRAKARELRDAIVKEKIIPKADAEDVEPMFKLQRQTWKGQQVIRGGPSRVEYHLLVRDASGNVVDFSALGNPKGATTGAWVAKAGGRWDLEGEVKPKTKYNPTKATPSSVAVLDSGKATWLIDEPDVKKLRLHGKELDGVYLSEREAKGAVLWDWKKTGAAPGA